MKCDFCGKEVAKGTVECPYCHYRFQLEAEVLPPEERDKFRGVTIDEDGTTSDGGYEESAAGKEETDAFSSNGLKVKTFGCSSSLFLVVFILLGILALFFFMLPAFLIFTAVFALIYLLRLLLA